VDVEVKWLKEGRLIPVAIYWQRGQDESETEKYVIDRVISGPEIRSSKVGGVGKRYVIEISGQRRNLFLEKDRWFLEVNR
jgi:hypothetical protein